MKAVLFTLTVLLGAVLGFTIGQLDRNFYIGLGLALLGAILWPALYVLVLEVKERTDGGGKAPTPSKDSARDAGAFLWSGVGVTAVLSGVALWYR